MLIKYIGREATRTYVKEGDDKVAIKPGETFQCAKKFGEFLLEQYGHVFVVGAAPKKKSKRKTQELKNKETA